jgi:hypothetical protein
MVSHARFLAITFLLALLPAMTYSIPGAESEEDLVARAQQETNPVKKSKYEIRLARLKLVAAINSNNQGNVEECLKLLGIYQERVKAAWEALRTSGRQATRQPQGFKDLDLSLRQDLRSLEDLQRRVPYDDREVVKTCVQEVEDVRSEVLRALFPPEKPRGAGETSKPGKGPAESVAKL